MTLCWCELKGLDSGAVVLRGGASLISSILQCTVRRIPTVHVMVDCTE